MSSGRTTAWVGWIWFAAIMVLVVGVLNVLYGLAAALSPDAYFTALSGQLLVFDTSTWGWVHLGVGALLILLAILLARGNALARVLTVIFVILNLLGQVIWLPAQPIWAVIAIVLDVLVLWAIIVHGSEVKKVAEG